MISELLSEFKGYYNRYGDKIILDNIKLKCGLYVKVDNTKKLDKAEYMLIEENGKNTYAYILNSDLEKKSNGSDINNIGPDEENLYNYFKIRYYYGIVAKNKNEALDGGAGKIFSTSYYAFAIKPEHIKTIKGVCNNEKAIYFEEEGTGKSGMRKFTDVVNTYFNNLEKLKVIETKDRNILNTVLKNIDNSKILEFNEKVDIDELKLNRDFILNNFKSLLHKFIEVEKGKVEKEEPINKCIYLFFNAEKDKYINEYKKYVIKYTFHKKDKQNYCIEDNTFFALSRFHNIAEGKPFLMPLSTSFNKNIKMNLEDLYYLKKFSEWLIYQDKNPLFINVEDENKFKPVDYDNRGREFFIIKQKVVKYKKIIVDYEYICNKTSKDSIKDRNVLQLIDKSSQLPYPLDEIDYDKMKDRINKVFFDYNLFKENSYEKYAPLMNTYREVINNIYCKNMTENACNILDTMSSKVIKIRVAEGDTYKIAKMLNLRWAILEYYKKNIDKIDDLLDEDIDDIDSKLRKEDNSQECLLSQCGALIRVLNGAKNCKNIYSNKFNKDISIMKDVINKKDFNSIKKIITILFKQRAHAIYLNDKTIRFLLERIYNADNFEIKDKFDYLLLGFLSVEKFI